MELIRSWSCSRIVVTEFSKYCIQDASPSIEWVLSFCKWPTRPLSCGGGSERIDETSENQAATYPGTSNAP